MGCYVNPPNMTKEELLYRKGEVVTGQVNIEPDETLILLIENPQFSAALVLDPRIGEKRPISKDDRRPMTFFKIKIEELEGSIPGADYLTLVAAKAKGRPWAG